MIIAYWLEKAKIAMPDFTFCLYGDTVSISFKGKTKCYHKAILIEPFPMFNIGSHFL